MNIRVFAVLLIAAMALSLLAGCSLRSMDHPISEQLDASVTIREIPEGDAPLASSPTDPQPSEGPQPLTEAEVMAIVLAHAGFAQDEVRSLRVERELRDRTPHFDVEFEAGRWEYEYEIHAQTGAVLSFDRDD